MCECCTSTLAATTSGATDERHLGRQQMIVGEVQRSHSAEPGKRQQQLQQQQQHQQPFGNTERPGSSGRRSVHVAATRPLPRSPHKSLHSPDPWQLRVETQEWHADNHDDRDVDVEHDDQLQLPPLFQRNSPSARKLVRSFLTNFLEEATGKLRNSIDLYQHALDSGIVVSDATVSELSAMLPSLTELNLAKCTQVTDAGLWAIARHCTQLRSLTLSGCPHITALGLRHVALNCPELEELNLTGCMQVDDAALASLGGGCVKLLRLSVADNPAISDQGLAKLARHCRTLEYLNVSGCLRVGEYGDIALLQLGASCPNLTELDMFGCRHIQDRGLKALAKCQKLRALRLSGCQSVTGKGLVPLAKSCTSLEDLRLAVCAGFTDAELAKLTEHCVSLQSLDISGCNRLTSVGVGAIANGCKKLLELNLSGCTWVNDRTSFEIARGCTRLRSLDLSDCMNISPHGVELLAKTLTGISQLKFENCVQITRAKLADIARTLEYAEVAPDYLGFRPRYRAAERRAAKELANLQLTASIKIQALFRGALVRKHNYARHRLFVIKYYLPLAQALVRGHIARVRYAKLLLTIREFHSAVAIQAAWRGWLKRSEYLAYKKRQARKRFLAKRATAIQRIWRGYMGRRIVQQIRDELRDAILAEAKLRARQEVKARVIQRHWRGALGRKRASQARKEQDADRALLRWKQQSALRIQRVYRGHLGRLRAQQRRDEVAHFVLCWRSARHIQRMYRGHQGRLECARMREMRRRELEQRSAIKIQAAWRGMRGRHLAALARGVELFRKTQIFYAVTLQRVYRGFKARARVTELKQVKQLDEKANAAAINIQRVYRGYKGRENREVEAQLIQFEHKARPLFHHLDELFRDRADWEQQLASLSDRIKQLEHEVEETTIELGIVSRSTSHWYDSSRINQTPQRFMTKYLQVRLQEHLERHQKLLEEAKLKATNLTIVLRMCDKDIRQTRRELIPLTTGVIMKTKRERTERLRNEIRRRAAAIVTIQSAFRGFRLRKAMGDAYNHPWITCTDDTSNSVYYYNPSTGQTLWKPPYCLEVWRMMQKVTPAEALEAFDVDEQQYGFVEIPEDETYTQQQHEPQEQQYDGSTVY